MMSRTVPSMAFSKGMNPRSTAPWRTDSRTSTSEANGVTSAPA